MSRMMVFLIIVISALLLIYDGYAYLAELHATPVILTQSGLASWYGLGEEGKRTASGELYDGHQFTAASLQLPFNTVVRVTNRINGQSVDVRINDRGPYKKSRILDLSEAAADALDMKKDGVVPVRVEILTSPAPNTVK